MTRKLAQIISLILHPVVIPTLGFWLLFQSGFYFSFLNWQAKRIILLIILFSTAILPLLAMSLLAMNPRFRLSFDTGNQRVMPLLFSSIFYYMGYMLLNRLNIYPVLKVLMIASVLVIIILMIVSFKWKISSHMAALGGLTGALLSLSFRTGVNPMWAIVAVILASGLAGSARLILGENKLWHLEAGYAIGFTFLYLTIYFI
jgi:hypothetical protein